MKKSLLLLLLPLLAIHLNAQKIKISVEEKNSSIGGSSHNCLVVVIYDSNQDDIEKEWKSKIEKKKSQIKKVGEENLTKFPSKDKTFWIS